MLAEFKIIDDPWRPSICTNLCAVCCRNKDQGSQQIGCCSYEPEFCLFDLVFLHLHYPDIYENILTKGQIIKGFNGIMVEMKAGLNQCPFIGDRGCVLPKDATTPLCRLYICREAARFGPAILEEKFDDYFLSKEYLINQFLNEQLTFEQEIEPLTLHNFVVKMSPVINKMIAEVQRINLPTLDFSCEINLEEFG